jgi:MarR family transcriptional regulator, 2-MHQ and catechol-resistance regulon repressor
MLKRIACPKDRRVTFAQITEDGKKFIQNIFPEHAEQIDKLMSTLTETEKLEAIDLLKKLGLPAGKF